MLSRRQLLGGVSLVGIGLVGATTLDSVDTGTLYHKAVQVEWERRGQRHAATLLRVVYSTDSHWVSANLAEPYTDAYERPASLSVPDRVHERLTATFDEVEYSLTFAQNGSIGGRVPRKDFNRVSVADEAEILPNDSVPSGSTNRVVSVTERTPKVTSTNVTTFPLDAWDGWSER